MWRNPNFSQNLLTAAEKKRDETQDKNDDNSSNCDKNIDDVLTQIASIQIANEAEIAGKKEVEEQNCCWVILQDIFQNPDIIWIAFVLISNNKQGECFYWLFDFTWSNIFMYNTFPPLKLGQS